jgi:predicted O-methyltransferase YrrM
MLLPDQKKSERISGFILIMTRSHAPYTYANLPVLLQKMAEMTIQSPSANALYTQSMLGEGEAEVGDGDPAFFDQINRDEALQIYSLVRSLRPENTLEIGFCCGGSGLAILQALEDNDMGTHHAVDPYQTSYAAGMGKRNVSKAGLGHRLRLFETFPENAFPHLPRVQFAFIDGSHLFDLTMLDFVLVDKLLESGSVLALHDTWMAAIQKLIRFILLNREYVVFHSSATPPSRLSLRSQLVQILRRICRSLPRSEQIFAPEFLTPWHSYNFSNTAFLKKHGNDQRNWRSFHRF